MKPLSLPLRLAFFALPFLPATVVYGQGALPAKMVDRVTLSADSVFMQQFSKLSGRSAKPDSLSEAAYQALCNRLMRQITAKVDLNTLDTLNSEAKVKWTQAQWEKATALLFAQDMIAMTNGDSARINDLFFKRTKLWQKSGTCSIHIVGSLPPIKNWGTAAGNADGLTNTIRILPKDLKKRKLEGMNSPIY